MRLEEVADDPETQSHAEDQLRQGLTVLATEKCDHQRRDRNQATGGKRGRDQLSGIPVPAIEGFQRVMEEAKAFMVANPGMKVDFAGAMRKRAQETEIAKVTGGVKAKKSQIPMVEQQSRFLQP